MISVMGDKRPPAATEALERFAYEEITAEIQSFIDDSPRGTQQRLAEAAFPELAPKHATTEFRHRMNERAGARFDYEHLGRIALAAGKLRGRADGAPAGWPLLRWRDAEAVDSVLKALRGTRA
jgi:hypothetical protein